MEMENDVLSVACVDSDSNHGTHAAHRNNSKECEGLRNNRPERISFKRVSHGPQSSRVKKRFHVGHRLKEVDIGVTEFISDHAPISGIVKDRYTDFQVNEIDCDGRIAKLTNQDIPSMAHVSQSIEVLKETVTESIWAQLEILSKPDFPPSSVEIDVTLMDKAERKAIHTIAKQLANVLSQTMEKDGKKIIKIVKETEASLKDRTHRRDNRVSWEDGNYCYFLLHKMNMDTMDALNRMAANMRLKANSFAYAGTKDRRAWTTQWVSLKKVTPATVLRAAKNVRGLFVGNFKFKSEPLKLGMLTGNRFRIALRNVAEDDERIELAMMSLKHNGFVNYYGLQRFGTVAVAPTYEIGKKLLQGKWDEAIDLILRPREGEYDEELAEAKIIYEKTRNPQVAYRKLKRLDTIEAKLLRGLCTSDKRNLQGALDSIPRNTRLMYIHAYQSFVWNHMVSKRIREFGKQPIVGDLVYENPSQTEQQDSESFDCDDQEDRETSETAGESQTSRNQKNENSTETASTDCSTAVTRTEGSEGKNLPKVKALTQEELPNYSLADVLMPQPGWRVTYPSYAKAWFDEFLAKDQLTTDLRRKNMKYSLSGTYRKMLRVPSDLSWKIVHYADRYDELIQPDIQEMRNLASPRDAPDGKHKALIIEMSLPSSTYATMALREILKQDTSPEVQAARSAAHENDP